MKQYDKDGAGLVNSTSSLWSIFREAVQDANAGSVTIVLDALDECVESETNDLMRHMEIQVRNGESSGAKLKLFMTSRPYEHVMSELYSLSRGFPRIHIPGEDESERISQEVNCVIRYRVEQFATERKLSNDVKACLQDQLLKMEHRTYLWVYLVFDYLQDFHFKRTPKGIASTFDALPKSVHQAYEQILSKSKDRQMVQKVLAIILAATRPLTLTEMGVAMEVDENTASIDDLDLEQEHDFKARLRSWCGLFVSVYHGRIYFLHQTARDFLLAEQLSSSPIHKGLVWHGFTTMKDAHTIFAECCVRFLSFFDNDDSLTTDQEQGAENRAFLGYSARFWALHVRESRICDDESAAVAPLTFKLSDPGAEVYRIWSKIYERGVYDPDPGFRTSLIVGCYFGHVAVVKWSLEKGADITSEGGEYGNALHVASYRGYEQIVKLLLDKGADINAQGGLYGNALYVASLNGHEQIVRLLLNKGADINADGENESALYIASERGYEQIVKLLLDKGANVNANGLYGSALYAASESGYEQIVKLLLDKGADINANGSYGSALYAASESGYEQIVKLLLDKGADVNVDREKRRALYVASESGHEQIVKLLLDKGADVNARGGKYGSALNVALKYGYDQIMKRLLGKGADFNADGGNRSALYMASCRGHEQVVKLLLDKGADINADGANGSALYRASEDGHGQAVELLLDTGKVDVNTRAIDGWTPLLQAAQDGHEGVVKLLLHTGKVDIHGTTTHGWTSLLLAVWSGQTAVVKLLLDEGKIDINQATDNGWTPLLQATQNGHKGVVKLLLDTSNVNVNTRAIDG
jgi:ankyrin repeat protein